MLGQIGGLWLALIGWFVTSSAAAERNQVLILGDLRAAVVGAIASTHPVTAAGWWTIDAFLDHIIEHDIRHRVFPDVDFSGAPVGVVSLQDLLAVRPNTGHITRVVDAARPLGDRNLALADEPLVGVLRRAPCALAAPPRRHRHRSRPGPHLELARLGRHRSPIGTAVHS